MSSLSDLPANTSGTFTFGQRLGLVFVSMMAFVVASMCPVLPDAAAQLKFATFVTEDAFVTSMHATIVAI